MISEQDVVLPKEGQTVSQLDDESLLATLKEWFRLDREHSAEWRDQAKSNFDFVVGRQWDAKDAEVLRTQRRPVITFNRTLAVIKAVCGIEINSRHDIVYMPRGKAPGRIEKNELLTSASIWMADNCDAEDEQSEAFQDCTICGMGWVETRVDYGDDSEGMYVEQKVDPLEMYWDRSARSRNIVDARRVFRVRKMTLMEARAFVVAIGADIPDDQLDASWAVGEEDASRSRSREERLSREGRGSQHDARHDVHIVHAQWVEDEEIWRVADPITKQELILDKKQFGEYRKLAKQYGFEFRSVRQTRKRYKQAFLGDSILGEVMDVPTKNRFTFKCVTGERDRNKGTWFGMVDVMRDPQQWANKWLSQALHILNSTAKGGVLAEEGAFGDQREFEETYARSDAVSYVTQGAISGGRIMAKPGAGMPNGVVQLMQFAIQSIRDATGINMELLGMRDANQPGVLEAQRKQAAMTILATLFSSLKRFRKEIGRARLVFIQDYLSDGRLIRIVGEDGAQVVPLLREETMGDYEVIIEEAPSSPNQREQTWQFLMQMLPFFKGMMTPEIAISMLEYSPLPSQLVEKLKAMASAQNEPNPEAEQQKMIATQGAVAKIDRDKASSEKDRAAADATRARAVLDLAQAGVHASNAQLQRIAAMVASDDVEGLPMPMADEGIADMLPQGGLPQVRQMPVVPSQPRAMPAPMGAEMAIQQLIRGS